MALSRAPLDRAGARAAERHSRSASSPRPGSERSDVAVRPPRCSSDSASPSSSGRRRRGRCPRTSPRRSSPTPSTAGARTVSGSPSRATPRNRSRASSPGRSSSDSIPGTVRRPRPRERGRPSGDPVGQVSLEEGAGIVHIAPGAGQEDFELGRVHDLLVLSPVDEAGRFYDEYGWLHGLPTSEVPTRSSDSSPRRNPRRGGRLSPPLSALLALRHTAHLARDRRLVDRGRRAPPTAARRQRDRRVDTGAWASAWTTGSATWATGTSRAVGTTDCRCRSTRARADT